VCLKAECLPPLHVQWVYTHVYTSGRKQIVKEKKTCHDPREAYLWSFPWCFRLGSPRAGLRTQSQ